MVNERLVQAGLAFCLYKMPNIKYEARLLKAQREAMRARHGMWKDWRETEGKYVGNRNSRRFHTVACPEVKRIFPKNRILFSKSLGCLLGRLFTVQGMSGGLYSPIETIRQPTL